MTYPLLFNLDSYIPGIFSTDDGYGTIWQFWHMKHYWQGNDVSWRTTDFVAYPFGVDLYRSGFVSYVFLFISFVLTIFSSPIITYNLILLINFIMIGICMYFLMFYLLKEKYIALFSAIAFAFCPYQFAHAWQHLGLTFNQWIPLCFLSVFLVRDRLTKLRALLFILSFLMLFSFDLHIMYFVCVALAVFLVYMFIYNWKKKISGDRDIIKKDVLDFKRISLLWISAFVLALPQFFLFLKNTFFTSSAAASSAHNLYNRPFEHLFSFSAKLLSYFLPTPMHPVFGKITSRFMGHMLYGTDFTEHTLFLGGTTIVLSFFIVKAWRRQWSQSRISKLKIENRDCFYIGFFALLAVISWFFSQPPWWNVLGIKIYMPSFFMYKILPMVRYYCRFGVMVMFAISVLAGFGLKYFLTRFNSNKVKNSFVVIFSLVILFEFANFPPFRIIKMTEYPEAYIWLSAQSDDVVIAEYPLDVKGLNIGPQARYKLYQTVHHKKMVNGVMEGSKLYSILQGIQNLSEHKSARVLKGLGVNYAVVHKDLYEQTGLVEVLNELEGLRKNPGLKFERSFDNIEIYEIIADAEVSDNAVEVFNGKEKNDR